MNPPPEAPCLTSPDVHAIEAQRIGRPPQVGLAISGGGIRSATFALGVVQALQRHGLFASLDYVSTVSGGGYLGAWLHALQRRGQRDRALMLDGDEPRQVRFLRAYSNYLTPQLGLFSGDTWAAVGTVTRNLVITFTLLSLSLLAVLCVPWAIHRTYQTWMDIAVVGGADVDRLLSVAFVLMVVAFATSASNMARPLSDGTWEADTRDWTPPWRVQMQVVVPILVAMAILAAIVDRLPGPPPLPESPSVREHLAQYWPLVWAGGGYALVWATGLAVAHLSKMLATGFSAASGPMATDWRTALKAWLQLTAFAWPAGIIGATVAVWSTTPLAWTELVELRMPLLVLGFLLALTAHTALAGTLLSDETREWWARVGGQVLLGTGMLSVLVFLSVYAPPLIDRFTAQFDPYGASKQALALLWAAVTGSGIVAGRSRKTSDGTGTSWMERIGRIAPMVFVVGYLLILAVVIVAIHQPCNALEAVGGVAAFGTLAFLLSRRADLNEFSLHALYRNRLVRCYLGASNARRQAHPFHGFDPGDDLRLDLSVEPAGARCRPYPIFNAAINLVGGSNLAWQQRKAASFVFTPDVCGYEYRADEQTDRGTAPAAGAAPPCSPTLSAYSRTAEHGSGPLTLGLAMATSGAAASPNMGYHSSPTLAFLMTVFNVRLGWWLRNPRYVASWTRSHKRLSLVELVSELLGLTTAERDFVYLSDGGHFENLGVYELVRRRVPFIIVSDAGQDGTHSFDDLGNAIEKCRADFGIDIELDVAALRPVGTASLAHCAVGTIHYEQADHTMTPGTVLYLKSTLTGDEPSDVLRYATLHPEFPHESTADQFFDESQFESYRALGYHIGHEVFEAVRARLGVTMTPAEMFRLLRQRWTPSAPAPAGGAERFSRTLSGIWSSVRSNPALRFLDGQIFPEWASLMATGSQIDLLVPDGQRGPRVSYWLPENEEQRRAGFYVCVEMLQLMEDVYLELRLDDHHDHIDNRGWMNLFQHWTWSGMLSATWAVTAGTYDPRFQRFCAERLGLRPGRVRVPSITGTAAGRPLPASGTWASWDASRRRAERQAWQESPLGLNFWEAELVAHFLDEAAEDGELSLHPIKVVVESPRREDGHPFEFTSGYLILRNAGQQAATLLHMRVQDHLRKMGVAGTALRELLQPAAEGRRRTLVVQVAPETVESVVATNVEALPQRRMAQRIERWVAALTHDADPDA